MATSLMFAPQVIDLALKAIQLYRTLDAENRAATADEIAALFVRADSADAAAVAADDAAQANAAQRTTLE